MSALALATITPPADDDADDVPPFAFPCQPPVARVRRRPGASGAPIPGMPSTAAPEPAGTIPEDDSNPSTARLRTVLEMIAAGKTQAEIGQHFGRSPRTIRDWYAKAKAQQVATFRQATVEDIAADIETKFARSYARWASILERAQEAGDLKLEIMAQARMDQSHVHRVQALARMGLFGDANLMKPPAAAETSHQGFPSHEHRERQANLLRLMEYETLSGAEDTSYLDDFGRKPEPVEPIY